MHLPVFFSLLIPLSTAFPIYFPPSGLTNLTSLDVAQVPFLADPAPALAWDQTKSPSVLLCQSPNYGGECKLLADSAPGTCLSLESNRGSPGMAVGSLKVGGGVGCVVFEAPACTGTRLTIDSASSIPDLSILHFTRKIASIFCEPLPTLSTIDPSDLNHQATLTQAPQSTSGRRTRRVQRRLTQRSRTGDIINPLIRDDTIIPLPTYGSASPTAAVWKPQPVVDGPSKPWTTNGRVCGDGPGWAQGASEACMEPGMAKVVQDGLQR